MGADQGVKMDAATYACVKDASPLEIVSCRLSGECGPGSPAATRPVQLKGEDEVVMEEEFLPKRDACKYMPPRSERAAAAKWTSNFVAEIQQEVTKKMPAALKAQFLQCYEGQKELHSQEVSPRAPRR